MITTSLKPIANVHASIGMIFIFHQTMKSFDEMETQLVEKRIDDSTEYLKVLIRFTCFLKSSIESTTEDATWIDLTANQINSLSIVELGQIAYEMLKADMPEYIPKNDNGHEQHSTVINDLFRHKGVERQALKIAYQSYGGLQGLSDQLSKLHRITEEQFSAFSKFAEPFYKAQLDHIAKSDQTIGFPNSEVFVSNIKRLSEITKPHFEQFKSFQDSSFLKELSKVQQYASQLSNIVDVHNTSVQTYSQLSNMPRIAIADSSTSGVVKVIGSLDEIQQSIDTTNKHFGLFNGLFQKESKRSTLLTVIGIAIAIILALVSLIYSCTSSRTIESKLEKLIEVNSTK